MGYVIYHLEVRVNVRPAGSVENPVHLTMGR